MPTQSRIRSSGSPRAARTAGSIEAWLHEKGEGEAEIEEEAAHDMTQGMLMSEFTAPKLTEIPQRRVAPTMRSLSVLSPVVKLRTAP